MRVKLYLLSLLPTAILAGWLTYRTARILGPWLIAPRDVVFLVVMTFVAGGFLALLNGALMLLLRLRLVPRGGTLVLVERSQLAKQV